MGARKLSWEPVRLGPIYCAPACGRGCTHAEYKEAFAKGRALANRCGFDWKLHVWENLGWHYAAVSPCGRLKVTNGSGAYTSGTYTAFLGDADIHVGGKWVESRRSPRAAIKAVIAKARREVEYLHSLEVGL